MAGEEVPLKPLGKEDIRRLELALLITALGSPEAYEELRGERQHLTWVDSLFVAAAALARDKAGIPVSKIADELGVTEETVRKHLRGETRAGQIIRRAYERIAKEGFRGLQPQQPQLEERLRRVRQLLEEALKELQA